MGVTQEGLRPLLLTAISPAPSSLCISPDTRHTRTGRPLCARRWLGAPDGQADNRPGTEEGPLHEWPPVAVLACSMGWRPRGTWALVDGGCRPAAQHLGLGLECPLSRTAEAFSATRWGLATAAGAWEGLASQECGTARPRWQAFHLGTLGSPRSTGVVAEMQRVRSADAAPCRLTCGGRAGCPGKGSDGVCLSDSAYGPGWAGRAGRADRASGVHRGH